MRPSKRLLSFYSLLFFMLFACRQNSQPGQSRQGNAYYISASGNDSDAGTKDKPWKTIDKLNHALLVAGDIVYFEGGQTFNGSIFIDTILATDKSPVTITSFGNGRAVINGGDSIGLAIFKSSHIHIHNVNFTGSGRKTGNTKDGVVINTCNNVTIDSIDIMGFQKSGLLVYNSSFVEVSNVHAHDNGAAGIFISGDYGKHSCDNVHVVNCTAENNPGDPTNLTNHSGNGIIAGYCKNITIEYCMATNNGWDMPRTGNGPVGIWCFEADSVIIQHCLAYANKTSKGGGDGGGFDLDGGVTNSIIQYCLSYQNQGSAFGIFQYAGASNWHDNIIRYNISENDGQVSPAHAGVFIWNSSRDTAQFKNCLFYNNVIYNDKYSAISYDKESEHAGFKFYNNIFVSKDKLLNGESMGDVFVANNWWNTDGHFNIGDGSKNFTTWVSKNHQELYNNKIVGMYGDPAFTSAGKATITGIQQLAGFNNYQLSQQSVLRAAGLDLHALFGINNGGKTFNGTTPPANGIGASF